MFYWEQWLGKKEQDLVYNITTLIESLEFNNYTVRWWCWKEFQNWNISVKCFTILHWIKICNAFIVKKGWCTNYIPRQEFPMQKCSCPYLPSFFVLSRFLTLFIEQMILVKRKRIFRDILYITFSASSWDELIFEVGTCFSNMV